jgi:DNA-directed RNA polymerase specialized sigma24 family protein
MSKRKPPSQEAFEKLLAWLDPDRDKAAEKYHKIYLRLVRIFAARGCAEAEDLADETVNVVAFRIDWLIENYVGDPALYFYGVARHIHQEWLKSKRPQPAPPQPPDKRETEHRCACLEKCLKKVTDPEEAEIVVRYHEGEGQARIANRKRIAEELGISLNALRIRICHIQARLRPCIEDCMRHFDG